MLDNLTDSEGFKNIELFKPHEDYVKAFKLSVDDSVHKAIQAKARKLGQPAREVVGYILVLRYFSKKMGMPYIISDSIWRSIKEGV